MKYDVIILGAGAAGLMAASQASSRHKSVLVLEHNEDVAGKIRISGGGKCNFTNRNVTAANYISQNPHFAKSALKRFSQHDFIERVDQAYIPYHERELGQLFCDDSANAIVDMLLDSIEPVEIMVNVTIFDVEGDGPYRVLTNAGTFEAPKVIVATGGLSIPKMGASGLAYTIAKRHGLKLTETKAGLVPLTFSDYDLAFMRDLTGVSLEARVSIGKRSFKEAVLFTHRGLSGPAILQISSYWDEGKEITVDLQPGLDVAAYLIDKKSSRPKAEPKTVLGELLPQRLAESLAEDFDLRGYRMADLKNDVLQKFGHTINNWVLKPTGTEGYRTAEVTIGGIDTDYLSSKTMEAKGRPGLMFIGEAVDVTGWLGGYNFQWAWSSDWVAGENV